MTRYIPMHTPGGIVWVEVEEHLTANIELTSLQDEAIRSFQKALVALKDNAKLAKELLEELSPQEIEITFGIKAGAEGGTPLFGLAKASGEASYTVKMKWEEKPTQQTTETTTITPTGAT